MITVKKITFFLIVISFIFSTQSAFAGGAIAQQKQMEQMKQQQIYAQKKAIMEAQKKAYEEAVRKRMQQYLAAKAAAEQKKAYQEALYQKMYQKKMSEKLAYEKAMKAAMQKKATQAVIQQKMQQQAIYQKRMQEKAKQEYALAMATNKKKQELMKQYQLKRQKEFEQYKQQQGQVLESREGERQGGPVGGKKKEKKEEIVTMEQVWQELDQRSEVWDLMIDRQPKELTVQREIDRYDGQGVKIKKSASYYTDRLDAILKENPEMKQYPLKNILRILAVMDYDFDNGQNKDLMAMEVLGAKLYLENKKRPGLLDDVY